MYPAKTTSAGGSASTAPAPVRLLTIGEVADLLKLSIRTIRRLADSGKMPRPVKVGALIRWKAIDLESWVEAGCPSVRRAGSR